MVTGLTYNTYVTTLAELAVVEPTNTDYLAILSSCIDYAELRCYQDLQLLATVAPRLGYSLVGNQSTLTIPMADFVAVQNINVITPAGTANPEAGTRKSLIPATKEWLQFVYDGSSANGLPVYFAPISQNIFQFGPRPDANYAAELIGTVRPASLAAGTQTTFLSLYLPSLFLMASMIFISGYQRNFGRQNDDPQIAVSYESQYKALLNSAGTEEAMKKFQSSGWTGQSAAPVASPPRA